MIRLALIPIAVVLAGCWTRPDVPPESLGSVDWTTVSADSEQVAFDRLDQLDRTPFDSAWKALDGLDYQIEHTISIRNADGEIVGKSSESLLITGSGADRRITRLSRDSIGVFEESFWSKFSGPDSLNEANWPSLALPEDPLFLSHQGLSFFRYALDRDTLIAMHSDEADCADAFSSDASGKSDTSLSLAEEGCSVPGSGEVSDRGETVSRVEVIARPETSRQGIQWARLYLSGNKLVGVDLVFVHNSLLYHEVSDSRILLSPSASGTWLPDHVHFESTVGLPFSRARSYELDASYPKIESP